MLAPLRLCVRRRPSVEAADTVEVSCRMPSDVSCIEQAVDLVTRHCLAGQAVCRHTRFKLQVVLSEALANAVMRGNRERPDTSVDVRVELRPDAIRLSVTDEGEGFDPASVPEPIQPDQLDVPGGRGLFLIRKLVDDVRFNERGNSICMTLRRHSGGSITSSMA